MFVAVMLLGAAAATESAALIQPQIVETRTVNLTQKVTLNDIPTDAGKVQMWVPSPGDTAWQRVLDTEVVSAPSTWKIVRQSEGRGDFVCVTIDHPKEPTASVVVKCLVQRQGVHFPLENAS